MIIPAPGDGLWYVAFDITQTSSYDIVYSTVENTDIQEIFNYDPAECCRELIVAATVRDGKFTDVRQIYQGGVMTAVMTFNIDSGA